MLNDGGGKLWNGQWQTTVNRIVWSGIPSSHFLLLIVQKVRNLLLDNIIWYR